MKSKPKKEANQRLKPLEHIRSGRKVVLLNSLFAKIREHYPNLSENPDHGLELFVREYGKMLGETSDEFFNYMMVLIETSPSLKAEILKKLNDFKP